MAERKPAKMKKKPGPKPGKRNGPRPGSGGRPIIPVDWEKVDALCAIHCTRNEIAEVLGISDDTLLRACKRIHKENIETYIQRKSLRGKTSLRRRQWKAADAGDKTMLVWLGKQWLGQVDRMETKTEHSGMIGPIIIPANGRDK